eukprot:g7633.t1
MLRRHFKQREAFRKTASAHVKQLNAAVELAVAAMDGPWSDLEKGWLVHQQHLVEIGIRPATGNEGVLRLNIGGLPANVHRSLLAEAEGFQGSVLGALFDQMWDGRLPRDADGRIVLDESPTCVKHLIHALLKGGCSKNAMATTRAWRDCGSRLAAAPAAAAAAAAAPAAVAADDEAYLLYISHVLGLSGVGATNPKTKGMKVKGGTAIASPLQLPRWSRMLESWLPGDSAGLNLLYRASRDGFATAPFQRRVRGVRETITLIRVRSGNGRVDSVVGGYTDIELVPREIGLESGNRSSSAAFLFLLHSSDERSSFKTVERKWSVKQGDGDGDVCAVHWPDTTDDCAGPAFGLDDLCVTFTKDGAGACTLSTRGEFYEVDETSPFLSLDGNSVAEIEVFRVERDDDYDEDDDDAEWDQRQQYAPVATTPSEAATTSGRGPTNCQPLNIEIENEMEEKYTRQFGASLAELLMEEQMALSYAQAELREAKNRAAAAAEALKIVYGPKVARGGEDSVVELSVRGMSVTTLRSTLEACPDSVFPAWLLSESSSAPGSEDHDSGGRGKMTDEDGRLKIDCNPNCFSKILDVMRMRKRATWWAADEEEKGVGGAVGRYTIRISIPENERGCFAEAVRKFFPGCEEFIMGLVEPWEDRSARAFVGPSFRGTSDRVAWTNIAGKPVRGAQEQDSSGTTTRRYTRRPASAGQIMVGRGKQFPRRASLSSTLVHDSGQRPRSAATAQL